MPPKANRFRSRKRENENGNSQGSCETLADDRTSAGSDPGSNWERRVCQAKWSGWPHGLALLLEHCRAGEDRARGICRHGEQPEPLGRRGQYRADLQRSQRPWDHDPTPECSDDEGDGGLRGETAGDEPAGASGPARSSLLLPPFSSGDTARQSGGYQKQENEALCGDGPSRVHLRVGLVRNSK